MARRAAMLDDIPDAEVTPQGPASVPSLGGAGGLTFELQDKQGGTVQHLADAAETRSRMAAAAPELDSIYNTVRIDVPQVSVSVDRDKSNSLGVAIVGTASWDQPSPTFRLLFSVPGRLGEAAC